MQQQRPTGVTILAVLAIIGGILSLCVSGIGALVGTLGIAATGIAAQTGSTETTSLATNTGLLYGEAIFALVIGVLLIVFGIGAFRLATWAWTLGIILAIVGILNDIVSIVLFQSYFGPVVGIIIYAIIVYYLFRPNIRGAFQRA